MFPLLVQQLSKKLNETEESERKLSAEEQEEEEEEEGDLEEEEDKYADEETNTETTEEEPDFTSESNYEPAVRVRRMATLGIQMLTKFLNQPG